MERTVTPLTGVARAKYMRDLTRKINNLHDKTDIADNLRTRLHISKPDIGRNKRRKGKNENKISVKLEKKDINQDYIIQRMKFLKQNIETVNQAVNSTNNKPTIWKRNKFRHFKDKSCEIEKQKLDQLYKTDMRSLKKELIREPKPQVSQLVPQRQQGETVEDTTCPVHVLVNDKKPPARPVHGSVSKQDDRDTTYPVHALIKSPPDNCPVHTQDNSANETAIICPVHILINTPDDTSNTCPVHVQPADSQTQSRSSSPTIQSTCPVHTLINHPITAAIVQDFQRIESTQNSPIQPEPSQSSELDLQSTIQNNIVQIRETQLQNIPSIALVPSNKGPSRRICQRSKRFKRYVVSTQKITFNP